MQDSREVLSRAVQAYRETGIGAADAIFAHEYRLAIETDQTSALWELQAMQCWLWAQTTRIDDALNRVLGSLRSDRNCMQYWAAFKTIVLSMSDQDACALIRKLRLEDRHQAYGTAKLAERLAIRGRYKLAKYVARRVIRRATDFGHVEVAWRAVARLGAIHEREGQRAEAIRIWRDSFDDGSRDRITGYRLTLNLYREKDYLGCVLVTRDYLASVRDSTSTSEVMARRAGHCCAKLGWVHWDWRECEEDA